MKNKIKSIIEVVLVILLVVTFIFYENANNKLINQLEQRDNLISAIINNDSAYKKTINSYNDTLEKYFSDCQFEINGKIVPTSEVLKLANRALTEIAYLEDSIAVLNKKIILHERMNFLTNEILKRHLKYEDSVAVTLAEISKINKKYDSVEVYKYISDLARNKYGLKVEVTKIKNGFVVKKQFSKIDTAMILFEYFKDDLRYDSAKNNWIMKN
ncbi:MAG: hypothetical protein HZA79_07440 [Sphingobacteriales bacterium]|nr:hypothetical protein [Sphingobacteriales bacterium]